MYFCIGCSVAGREDPAEGAPLLCKILGVAFCLCSRNTSELCLTVLTVLAVPSILSCTVQQRPHETGFGHLQRRISSDLEVQAWLVWENMLSMPADVAAATH